MFRFRERGMRRAPSGLLVPDLVNLNGASPETTGLLVHGVADGPEGGVNLGWALEEGGVNLHAYRRSGNKDEDFRPRRHVGTGTLQAAGTEMWLELLELTQNDKIKKIGVIGHSMGGAVILQAIRDAHLGNLASCFKPEDKQRINEIANVMGVNLVASAGLSNDTWALPGHGFGGIKLGQVVWEGIVEVVNDSGGLLHSVSEINRLKIALEYLLDVGRLVPESIDACSPGMLKAATLLNPEKTGIFTYRDDPLFTPKDLTLSLSDPSSRDIDMAVISVLKGNLQKARRLASENHGYFSEAERASLIDLEKSIRRMEGCHTTMITSRGAKELAPHLVFS